MHNPQGGIPVPKVAHCLCRCHYYLYAVFPTQWSSLLESFLEPPVQSCQGCFGDRLRKSKGFAQKCRGASRSGPSQHVRQDKGMACWVLPTSVPPPSRPHPAGTVWFGLVMGTHI